MVKKTLKNLKNNPAYTLKESIECWVPEENINLH